MNMIRGVAGVFFGYLAPAAISIAALVLTIRLAPWHDVATIVAKFLLVFFTAAGIFFATGFLMLGSCFVGAKLATDWRSDGVMEYKTLLGKFKVSQDKD